MNKLGVRLIALVFIIGAITDVYGLVTGTRHAQGGLGFDLGLTYNGKPIDVMAWMEVVVLLYAGIQLLRFHPSGRNWALFIFWVMTVFAGIFLFWFIGSLATASIQISNPPWLSENSRSIFAILLLIGIIIVFCLVPIYFLMREDVKQLFEKPVAVEGTTNIIQGEKS